MNNRVTGSSRPTTMRTMPSMLRNTKWRFVTWYIVNTGRPISVRCYAVDYSVYHCRASRSGTRLQLFYSKCWNWPRKTLRHFLFFFFFSNVNHIFRAACFRATTKRERIAPYTNASVAGGRRNGKWFFNFLYFFNMYYYTRLPDRSLFRYSCCWMSIR